MLESLLRNNMEWAERRVANDPAFFRRLANQQSPRYLWIGCSDSRVPANEIIGLDPGEVFVHRNVGNLVIHSDMNCLAVLQYAIEVLQVVDIIVCGHYGCGGIRAALDEDVPGVIANWLRPIRDLADSRQQELAGLEGPARLARVCELNVERQVEQVSNSTVVTAAWRRGQAVAVHGWIYGLSDGRLRNLDVSRNGINIETK